MTDLSLRRRFERFFRWFLDSTSDPVERAEIKRDKKQFWVEWQRWEKDWEAGELHG